MKNYWIVVGLALSILGCKPSFPEEIIKVDKVGEIHSLEIGNTFYWQLDGIISDNLKADILDIDLYDVSRAEIEDFHQQGKLVICYFSAGSFEEWREQRGPFPIEAIGHVMDGWEEEKWVDVRNQEILQLQITSINFAKEKGCDGVEPDNVDGYQNNTGFDITVQDQIKYNRQLASYAHQVGLFIGLKNSPDLVDDLAEYFDFSLVEECWKNQECDKYSKFILLGKPVFVIVYDIDLIGNSSGWTKICNTLMEERYFVMGLPIQLDGNWIRLC